MANMLVNKAYVCTPSSLMASNPCLACLSEKELLAALVGIFAIAHDLTIADILRNSACYTCLSKKQMLQALVTITGNNLLGESRTVPDVIAMIKCLECSNDKQLLAALLYLVCNDTGFTMEEQET
jgi:hypothetical protein